MKTSRVGLVGAGQISEFHIRALRRLSAVAIVGITDLDTERARAVAERFHLAAACPSLGELLDMGVDVVHVLTPPATHAAITMQALERGCHVLVEKPLATSVEDCDRIIRAARKAGKIVGVDHAMLFDPFVVRALELVWRGKIGDVVAVDYFRSQAYPPYLGGPLPVHYREGGYPFRDIGVHALYLLEAFLGDIEDVQSQFTNREGDPNLLYNEWRVLARCRRGTGHAHLSWNTQPFQNVLLIQGTRGTIRADLFGMSVTVRRTRRLPGFVDRAVNAWSEARQALVQVPLNLVRAALGRIRRYHGLQAFVAAFYKSVAAGLPAPVTPEQARSVVDWTERIARRADRAKEHYLDRFPKLLTADVLLTGAGGFIGKHLLKRLLDAHERVRVFVRRPAPELLSNRRIEIVLGDLGDPAAVDRAVAGTSLVYHVGAACKGSAAEFQRGTVIGTENIVASVLRHNARLVHISSISVLHAAATRNDQPITEAWPLEPYPQKRGLYTQTKLEAERVVRRAVQDRGLRAVILRPGLVFGPGGSILNAVGRPSRRRLIMFGNGQCLLPLVYVDDLVDIIVRAAHAEHCDGDVYHVVDGATMTANELVRRYVEATGEARSVWRLPRLLIYPLAAGVQLMYRLLRRPAPLSIYRLRSTQWRGAFDCTAARELLGWRPRVGVEAGLDVTLASLKGWPPHEPPLTNTTARKDRLHEVDA